MATKRAGAGNDREGGLVSGGRGAALGASAAGGELVICELGLSKHRAGAETTSL